MKYNTCRIVFRIFCGFTHRLLPSQDDFDDLLDNMDAEFQAAPAAHVTASQRQAMEMDEFERQLAMGELDDAGPGGGSAAAGASEKLKYVGSCSDFIF